MLHRGRRAILRAVPHAPGPPLRLRLSGAPEADGAAGPVALGPVDALMLAWLALEGPTPRERIATLLWPGSGTEAARNALRQRLFRLRRQVGRDVVGGAGVLALAEGVQHDLTADGPLLGTLRAPECADLDNWLEAQRGARRAALRRATETRIEALEAAGDIAAALPLAQALADEEPLSEDTHRRLMRLHYLRGDRAAALLAFDRCEQMLKHEIGTTPSAATLALLATLESAVDVAAPVAWRPAVPASVLRPPRLIGREAEMSALRRGWRAGSVVLVTGEAGMGKSRLLQALGHESNGGVVVASGRPGDALVPYGSFSRLMREVAARAPEALDSAARGRLAALLPSNAAVEAKSGRRPGLLDPVREFLHRARRAFDGLVFDDVHFADDASIELLQSLLASPREDQPLRWCLGLRPPPPGSRLQELVDALATAAPLTQVPVRPLDVEQVAELVDSLALEGVKGDEIAPVLRQRSGGNPLYALETLKAAWAEGALERGAELPRPQSLGQLIGQQLARLSQPALNLARVAAVAGTDFSLRLAEKVLDAKALQLADAWHELETQQVMQGTDFAHDLIHEAVTAGLPAVIACHLHGEIAGWLEAEAGEPARIAAHWEAAGERLRALPSLRAAADRAHVAQRERERIDFLLRGAAIAETTGRRGEAFAFVASAVETHMNSIRDTEGFPLLDRLDALADTPSERARALGQRAWYCSQLERNDDAVRCGEQALALAATLDEPMLAAQIRQRLATALSLQGRFDDALGHFEALEGWAEQHLAAEDLAEFHGNFAVVLNNIGRPEPARAHHRRASAEAAAAGDPAHHVTQLANHAANRLGAGDVAGARPLVAQAQQLVATYSLDGSSIGFLNVLQLQCARAEGRYAEALACAAHAEALLAVSNPGRVPVVRLQCGHIWLDLGQHARALQELQAGSDALSGHFAARRLLLLSRVQRALGRDGQAPLVQALAAAPPNGWPEVRLLVRAELALLAGDADTLDALAAEAARLGLHGAELATRVQRAALADGAAAARAAHAALGLGERVQPSLLTRGDLLLAAARAFTAAGEDAAPVRAAGRRWLDETAAQVPDSFRESFLERHPTHRALRA
jgi:DNA-binding SARP family transcriptional activator